MRKSVHACLHRKESLDGCFLPQTEHDVVAAVMLKWQAHRGRASQGETQPKQTLFYTL